MEIARLLLDHGAKMETKDKYNNTTLPVASWLGSAAMVQLDRKANVNNVNNKGPLLMHACRNRFEGEAMIPILIANGADPSLNDNDDDTVLHYAYKTSGSMVRAIAPFIAPFIAPNGQLQDKLPASICPDPISSMREAIPYGLVPRLRDFRGRVDQKKPVEYCWSMLRVAPLCLDSSNHVYPSVPFILQCLVMIVVVCLMCLYTLS